MVQPIVSCRLSMLHCYRYRTTTHVCSPHIIIPGFAYFLTHEWLRTVTRKIFCRLMMCKTYECDYRLTWRKRSHRLYFSFDGIVYSFWEKRSTILKTICALIRTVNVDYFICTTYADAFTIIDMQLYCQGYKIDARFIPTTILVTSWRERKLHTVTVSQVRKRKPSNRRIIAGIWRKIR